MLMKRGLLHMTDPEREAGITIHKTAALGLTRGLTRGLDMQQDIILEAGRRAAITEPEYLFWEPEPYIITNTAVEPEPLWSPEKHSPPGRPKRNKSKLKQQRNSRRRNR